MNARALIVIAVVAAAGSTVGYGAATARPLPVNPAPRGPNPALTSTVRVVDDQSPTSAVAVSGPPVAPGSDGAASACRPANHRGVITSDRPSAGHRHYRVTLSAPSGYAPCRLGGVPTQVVFHGGGAPLGIQTRPEPGQAPAVSFGPGHPVHFDIQVPNTPGGARAGSITFMLPTPTGPIPGEQEASGALQVDAGTQIGPIQPGN